MSKLEGFSANASDLFRIATVIAGFDPAELMREIHRHAPERATVSTVERAMSVIDRRADGRSSRGGER